MTHSDKTQIAALDSVIAFLRAHRLPPNKECDLLAEQLGTVRDRVARAMKAAEEKRGGVQGGYQAQPGERPSPPSTGSGVFRGGRQG
jgi:hypothetical protein